MFHHTSMATRQIHQQNMFVSCCFEICCDLVPAGRTVIKRKKYIFILNAAKSPQWPLFCSGVCDSRSRVYAILSAVCPHLFLFLVAFSFTAAYFRLSALTQPEVEVVLQVPGALFDGVEDEVGVSGVKSPVQVLRNGHQVKVLHPPHLETRLLSGPLELWVVRCHPACREITHLWLSS